VIHTYVRTEPDTLKIQGSPDELYGAENGFGFVDYVAGLTVARVSTEGKHDGHPATIVHLADDMGEREIGRLVLRHELTFKEEIFDWERVFPAASDLEEFVTQHEAAINSPIVTSWQDLCWEGYQSIEHAVAGTAAEFGVSIEVLSEQGGNGWPEIKIFGLRPNVRRCLIEGWKLGATEVDAELR
jgi:hypothetical protein